jgi:hypothetical protein
VIGLQAFGIAVAFNRGLDGKIFESDAEAISGPDAGNLPGK